MTTLDRFATLEPGVRASAVRHVPSSLDVFTTHFPLFPVLPGVLILDDLIELSLVALSGPATTTGTPGWQVRSVHRVRYRHFVSPGDSMELEVAVTGSDQNEASCRATARVDGKPVTIVAEIQFRRKAR